MRLNEFIDRTAVNHVIQHKEVMVLMLESFDEVDIVVTSDFCKDDELVLERKELLRAHATRLYAGHGELLLV